PGPCWPRARAARCASIRPPSPAISSCRRLLPARGARLGLVGLLLVVDPHQRSVVEVLGDGAVAAGDDLVAFLQAVEDLDALVALDPGLHLVGHGLAALDAEHDLDEPVAVGLEPFRRVLALLALLYELIDGAQGHALDRHAQGT